VTSFPFRGPTFLPKPFDLDRMLYLVPREHAIA